LPFRGNAEQQDSSASVESAGEAGF